MSGYVRIHRALIGHPAFRNDAEAMAFAWMIARAAWKPTRVRYKEHGIYLDRGQLAISQRDMAEALDRDKGWVERLWKRLKSEAMIEADCKAGVAVITICNYAEYQADCDDGKAAHKAQDKADARQTQGTEQRREKGKKKSKAILELPDWMPLDSWDAYVAMRAGIRNVPFEIGAQKLLVGKITRLRSEGHCPRKLLDEATLRGYRSVFESEATKATVKPLLDKPLTEAELQSAIRYHRDNDNEAKAQELEAELKSRAA